ncbi:hypothetical protein [Streptomyces tendae]|uniref:hypothetical protein n=1 Tax=Streptomyces tendae TaxID=1932 RepID=UPI0036557B76
MSEFVEEIPGATGTIQQRVTEVIENEVPTTYADLATRRVVEVVTDWEGGMREETLRLAAAYLRTRYGVTNRAAGDLLRLAELESQGRSALDDRATEK